MQLLAIMVVVVACASPSLSWSGIDDVGSFIKNKVTDSILGWLKNNQDAITKKVQEITVKGEEKRLQMSPEYVKGSCKPVNDAMNGQYDPKAVTGKWYATLQSNDIYEQGAAETLKGNRECISYDITETGNGLQVVETSYSDAAGKQGKKTVTATLTKTNEGTATFAMKGSETGFNLAQLTASKKDDHAVWYYCRNNSNGTFTVKMTAMSRTPKISVNNLLAFHNVVILKNVKTLFLHPRLFHIDQTTCPKL